MDGLVPSPEELMQLGRAQLSPSERLRRLSLKVCLENSAISYPHTQSGQKSKFTSARQLCLNLLVDSGPDGCLIDREVVRLVNIPTVELLSQILSRNSMEGLSLK